MTPRPISKRIRPRPRYVFTLSPTSRHAERYQAQKRKPSLTREEVEDLRQVERERVEMIRLRQLGIDIPRTMGVRADYVEFKDMKFD
jgi:hypothetical protein